MANKVQYEWKVLVVDEFAMKVVSSCFKTEEILACNIACMLCLFHWILIYYHVQ